MTTKKKKSLLCSKNNFEVSHICFLNIMYRISIAAVLGAKTEKGFLHLRRKGTWWNGEKCPWGSGDWVCGEYDRGKEEPGSR